MALKLLDSSGQCKFTSRIIKAVNTINTQMPTNKRDDIQKPEAALNMGRANIPPPIQVPIRITILPKTLLVFTFSPMEFVGLVVNEVHLDHILNNQSGNQHLTTIKLFSKAFVGFCQK